MAMNFENYQKEAKTWLHEFCDQLGIEDEHKAARIFRARVSYWVRWASSTITIISDRVL